MTSPAQGSSVLCATESTRSLDVRQRGYGDRMDVEFSGEVFEWRGPSPYYFVAVPDEESALIESLSSLVTYGWGMIPVGVMIGSSRWTTSLYPKEGLYVVPLKSAVRKAEGLEVGERVSVRLDVSAY